MKKINSLLIIIFFISCSTDKENTVIFNDQISFEHINFNKKEGPVNEQFNSFVAKIKSKNESFLLHIVDVNKNGEFNDAEDAIMINPYTSILPQNIVFNNKINSKNYFSINSNVIKVSKIKKNNSIYEASLEWNSEVLIDKVALENRMIDRLPDLEYYNFNKEKVKLSSFLHKNKYIYIEFWALWCSPCLSFIPEIKDLNGRYPNQLEIISIASDRQFDQKATYSYI